jgi:hypothetical protein
VQPPGVVVGADAGELGVEHGRVTDAGQVGPVALQGLNPTKSSA